MNSRKLGTTLILLLVANLQQVLMAAEQQWELKRDREGIQVYTRDVENSRYDAVRSETIVSDVRLSALVALIDDAEACADWADRCAESYEVERVSATEAYVYTHNDMPFPVTDRDVVAHVQWQQDTETLVVEMHSSATTGKLEQQRGRLRLTEAVASWRFEPMADGRVKISNEAHINPGSALPGWVTNMLLVDTPFETMKAFVAEVRKPQYQGAELGFIQEP